MKNKQTKTVALKYLATVNWDSDVSFYIVLLVEDEYRTWLCVEGIGSGYIYLVVLLFFFKQTFLLRNKDNGIRQLTYIKPIYK